MVRRILDSKNGGCDTTSLVHFYSPFWPMVSTRGGLVWGWLLAWMLVSNVQAQAQVPTPAQRLPAHALLIGVSGYPQLPPAKRLRGPANDVMLLRRSLLDLGFSPERVVVLADGVPGSAALPTRGAIVDHMAVLARRVRAGDWVVLYFSGHGSQQPQPDSSRLSPGTYLEPDGLDEIFLAYDVGRWQPDPMGSGVQGVVLDDEIQAALASLIQAGAKVWAIFDTCHAGGMAKGMPIGLGADAMSDEAAPRTRYVDPRLLGVPEPALAAARQRARAAESNGDGASSSVARFAAKSANPADSAGRARQGAIKSLKEAPLIAFYAAQPDEPAAEERLPPPPGREPLPSTAGTGIERHFGYFTYVLAQALHAWSTRAGSYRQLADTLKRAYQTRPFPTPMFEGPMDLSLIP